VSKSGLTTDERRRELLAVEIRLRRGVDLPTFQQRHGALTTDTHASIQALIQKGWIEQKNNTIKLTPSGILFYDSVAIDLI
jgi:coproporphyrinogen III oxidase-like Fe-S oxidoreductase